MKLMHCLTPVFVLSSSLSYAAPSNLAGSTSPLAITQSTQIPGSTLKEGSYSITVVDNLSDRMIIRIDNPATLKHAIFLAVPGKGQGDISKAGPVLWPVGLNKTPALRGFTFSDGARVEFVYPKAEAAALAKANSAKVVAVDPESEGHAALKNLSSDELQVVNLWMLSLTSSGIDGKTPAVLAQHYEGQLASPATAASAPVVASATPSSTVTKSSPPVETASKDQNETNVNLPRGGSTQPSRHRSVVAQLPHTGSLLPIVWMVGLLSFAGAGILRTMRAVASRKAA